MRHDDSNGQNQKGKVYRIQPDSIGRAEESRKGIVDLIELLIAATRRNPNQLNFIIRVYDYNSIIIIDISRYHHVYP